MTKQSGFTLVELAIALMVIGLLIGGVLKGQELIENARITRTIKDVSDYDTAAMIFVTTYNGYPGDIRRTNRIPNCSTAPCSDIGSGDKIINSLYHNETQSFKGESKNFWIHLSHANLINTVDEDKYDGNMSAPSPFGGYYVMRYGPAVMFTTTAGGPNENTWFVGDSNDTEKARLLSCPRIAKIDQKMDDGKPLTGSVKVYETNIVDSQQCYSTATSDYIAESKTRTAILIKSSALN